LWQSGRAGPTFIRHMRKALDIALAVFGLLVGIPCVLWAVWIMRITLGGGLEE